MYNVVHDELNLYGSDNNFVHEARVTIGFADGRKGIVKSLVAIDSGEDGRLVSRRVYNDPQGLEP